uniref:Peptidase M12A domain-containing protein n=1 Tax=Anopheles culicifacies TaxID=139723 RepID=A0A182MUK9_9DIPT
MKLFWVMLIVMGVLDQSVGSPVKRNSPTDIEMASELEEKGGNFEGDIELTSDQEQAVKYGYTAIIGESYKWPNNIVPYTIDTNAFTVSQQNSILSAIQQIELVSCVRFKPRTTETDYVKVMADRAPNFDRYNSNTVEDFGIPYDYDSVMHYGPTAFSYNGQATIIPKQSGVTIGQRVGLSYKDIKRLNFFYPNCY